MNCPGPISRGDLWAFTHVKVKLRVGTDGSSSDTTIRQWSSSYSFQWTAIDTNTESQSGAAPYVNGSYPITNADQGALVSWELVLPAYCASATNGICSNNVADKVEYHLSTSNGTDTTWNEIAPNQVGPVQPVLQLQDGSFVGTASPGGRYASGGPYMVKFDTSGNVLATTSGYYPQMATADGGVVSQDGTFFDSNLNVTSAVSSLPTQSWLGNSYQNGSVEQLSLDSPVVASSFWASAGGNPSNNSTAAQRFEVKLHTFVLSGTQTIPLRKYIESARDTWSKQSNGTIALVWGDNQLNVDPCVIPGCIRGIDEDDLLEIPSYVSDEFWRKTNYFFQKFPNRKGIVVVHNATLANNGVDLGLTLPLPLAQSGQFSTTQGSNIIVLPNQTGDVLKHEIGHALGLIHVDDPLNLMCGTPPGMNWILALIDPIPCWSSLTTDLSQDQLKKAKSFAADLMEK